MVQKKHETLIKHEIDLKNKIINHLQIDGYKHKSENFLLLSIKNFQKKNEIDHRAVFEEAVLNLVPTFLLKQLKKLKRKNRKDRQVPFYPKKNLRILFALKMICLDIKQKEHSKKFYKNITEELFLSAEQTSKACSKLDKINEKVVEQKKFIFFKWF